MRMKALKITSADIEFRIIESEYRVLNAMRPAFKSFPVSISANNYVELFMFLLNSSTLLQAGISYYMKSYNSWSDYVMLVVELKVKTYVWKAFIGSKVSPSAYWINKGQL